MSILSSVNRFLNLFLDTFRQVGRGRIWLVLTGFGLLNWLILYAHYDYLSSVFYSGIRAWTSLFSSQMATGFYHYPGHYLMLPYYFDWARFLAGLLLDGIVLGVVASMFWDCYHETPAGERTRLRTVLASWGHLILGWLLLNGLMLAAIQILPGMVEHMMVGSPRVTMAFEFVVMPGIYVGLMTLFFFVVPIIGVYGETFPRAVWRSLVVFIRNPITCLFLAGTIMLGPVIVSVVTGRAATIVDKFKPELVFWVLTAGLVVDLLASFLWMGTAVRFLIDEEH